MVIQLIHKKLTPILIVLSFLNFPIFSLLRLSDLIIIFLSLFNPRFHKILIIFSTLCSLHFMIVINLGNLNLFWYVKFLIAFATLVTLNKYVRLELSKSVNLLKLSLMMFISWVYIKLVLVFTGIINGSFRVSFPTADFSIVDSHLYAQVLTILGISFGIVAYLRSGFERPNPLFAIIIGGVWLLANVLTSSRNGIVITLIVLIFCFLVHIFKTVVRLKIAKYNGNVLALIMFIVFITFQNISNIQISEQIYSLIDRSMNSLSLLDGSTSVRLRELNMVLYEVDSWTSFLGNSIFSGRIGFYDGVLTLSLAIFGTLLTGLFMLATLFLLMYLFVVKKLYYTTGILIVYCMQNLISEFVFVSRGAVFSLFAILVVFRTEQEVNRRKASMDVSGNNV